jgi:16S rRNA A1518/A1519 N6-dimethyltransferase RsmA/KsgA/DIM1 with predicted DNA glycosylase/AP lyase activity
VTTEDDGLSRRQPAGPGPGLVTRRLVAHGASVVAVEPDPAMAEFLASAMRGAEVTRPFVTVLYTGQRPS